MKIDRSVRGGPVIEAVETGPTNYRKKKEATSVASRVTMPLINQTPQVGLSSKYSQANLSKLTNKPVNTGNKALVRPISQSEKRTKAPTTIAEPRASQT